MTEEEFNELRPSAAFAIVYRMLGSVSEAEDVVQDGFLRLHRAREAASGSSRRAPTWPRWSRASRSTTSARPDDALAPQGGNP